MTPNQTESVHHSNRAFYDRISGAYDFIADASERAAREAGEKALQLKEGESVLEIGFGTGNSIIDLAQMVGTTGKVCGIDISQGMLEVTEEKIDKKDLPANIELQIGDARQLPYEDSSFDAVFTSFTLELFPLDEIPHVLSEVRRILKPGGRLGVVSMATVKEGEKESLLERTYIWMHRHFPHIVDCQPIDAAQLLCDAGFDIREEKRMEMWTMPVAAVIGVKANG